MTSKCPNLHQLVLTDGELSLQLLLLNLQAISLLLRLTQCRYQLGVLAAQEVNVFLQVACQIVGLGNGVSLDSNLSLKSVISLFHLSQRTLRGKLVQMCTHIVSGSNTNEMDES